MLPISYMCSLGKKEWRTGHQMVFSAVRHAVAEKFVQICAGLRVNKRSHFALGRIRKAVAQNYWPRWLTHFCKEVHYVWLGMRRMALPQGAVPSGESTVVGMRADHRKLVHTRLTKPSCTSIIA